jgi:hypothetical protein
MAKEAVPVPDYEDTAEDDAEDAWMLCVEFVDGPA